MKNKNVSNQVEFISSDDESLSILKCVCGVVHKPWDAIISIYDDEAIEMPCCGRKLFWRQTIQVFEVKS